MRSKAPTATSAPSTLYYGDNLKVLREYVEDESADLIYLDPPFNSGRGYNVLFKEQDGTEAVSQIRAFEDTWRWDVPAAQYCDEVIREGGKPGAAMEGFQKTLGPCPMLAYLSNMAVRLIELYRVLKATGSLYLHCDPTASHYLKVLLDSIFGAANFKNEVIWRRTGAHGPRKSFGPIHDTILFYVKSSDYYFKLLRRPYMKGHVESRYRRDHTGELKFTSGGNVLTGAGATGGESGKPWRGFDPSKKNRHWAIPGFLTDQMPPEFDDLGTLDKLETLYKAGLVEITEGNEWPTPLRYLKPGDGSPMPDTWAAQPYTKGTVHDSEDGIDADVMWLGPKDPERLGYQTQKPEGLLERIIESSCPKGGVVLDPFCGCGTSIAVAERLKRPWVGIDITHLAITLIKYRLVATFGSSVKARFKVIGEPEDLQSAKALALQDRDQFEHWALGLVNARAKVRKKKGKDKGIDGTIPFQEGGVGSPFQRVIVSVKSGENISSQMVRDLVGTITREKGVMGVLLTLEDPTRDMVAEAASAGFYESPWGKAPKVQILTVEQLLEGKQIKGIPDAARVPLPTARRGGFGKKSQQGTLVFGEGAPPEDMEEDEEEGD